MDLKSQKCIPCEVGGAPFTKAEADVYMKDISDWTLSDDVKKISRQYKFKDFKESMIFVNKVAELAEREGHHPDIFIRYNKVDIELTTHAVNGLSVNDFILAAKIDQI